MRLLLLLVVLVPNFVSAQPAAEKKTIKILFLGDNGHHRPSDRHAQLAPVLAKRGIVLKYTNDLKNLDAKVLKEFDGLLIYANHTRISDEQEKALLNYVENGGGFIPIHCASACFGNSAKYVRLVGAQFARHGAGTFRTQLTKRDHPVTKGFGGFESWDETYVHRSHNNKNRTVLAYRVDPGDKQLSGGKEPWTWVRTQGKGRVFYTAWGHDQRTWGHAGFQNLIERGIRWAVKDDPAKVAAYTDPDYFPIPKIKVPANLPPLEYIETKHKIPNYTGKGGWGTQGKDFTKMQKPLSPEASEKRIRTPVGFTAKLFASEKDGLVKPICINWDERGRLWVCATIDYPNDMRPPGKGNDKVLVVEDTNNDGKADRVKVFAEKLSIPTALAFCRGGVIVQDGSQTLYLKDTNGDDKADLRKVLISGWAMGDTHGGVSNFRYGLDNWYWGMQGYNFSRPRYGKDLSKQHPGFRQGFFRFKLDQKDPPTVTEIEFIRSTNNNTWGLGFSEEGHVFGSTANRNPSVHMPIANRYYERVRGWSPKGLGTIADNHYFKPVTENVRQVDHHGGYTAGAGHALYTARTYPKEYWNRVAFVNGPTGHLTGVFLLKKRGSGFRSSNIFNLVASDDEWFAPIAAEVGPDGHVWICDWYNYIVQHNPTPRGFKRGKGNAYETPLRDKIHGRIYRVVYDKATSAKRYDLTKMSGKELVGMLKHPNMFWRLHAQRLLVERGGNREIRDLAALAGDPTTDDRGSSPGVVHALWTLDGLDQLGGLTGVRALARASKHPSAHVRASALDLFWKTGRAPLSRDVDAADRQAWLRYLLSLSDLYVEKDVAVPALSSVLKTATDPQLRSDPHLVDAATCVAASVAPRFLLGLRRVRKTPTPQLLRITRTVTQHYARHEPNKDVDSAVIAGLQEIQPALITAILDGISDAPPRKFLLTAEADAAITVLMGKVAPTSRAKLIRLAAAWGSKSVAAHIQKIQTALLGTIGSDKAKPGDRIAATKELASFRSADGKLAGDLLGLIDLQTPPEVATGIIDALRESTHKGTATILIENLARMTPKTRMAAVRVLLSRAEFAKPVLAAILKREVPVTELSLEQRQAVANHPDATIRRLAKQVLAKTGGLPDPDRQKVIESLIGVTKTKGDAKVGVEVFKKHCAVCHVHGKLGKRIGPDLTGMAVHPKEELLVHILDPSRSVEGNFRSYAVQTKRGQTVNGMLASETRTSLEIVDTKGKRHVVAREDISRLRGSNKSVMPDGFEKTIDKTAMANLLEFLTSRGKFLPLPLAKYATAISTKPLFHNHRTGPDMFVLPNWNPRVVQGVPFVFVDPKGTSRPNIILLHGPNAAIPRKMPKNVAIPINGKAKLIHFLSGVGGWSHPYHAEKSVSMTVRLKYSDGKIENHALKNGVHFADYIRRVDVPGSKFAFMMRGQQMRYLVVTPKRGAKIESMELVKGKDQTSPVVLAITVESP